MARVHVANAWYRGIPPDDFPVFEDLISSLQSCGLAQPRQAPTTKRRADIIRVVSLDQDAVELLGRLVRTVDLGPEPEVFRATGNPHPKRAR